jgi:hypothetical protein
MGLYATPADVDISQVRHWSPGLVLGLVEHLPKLHLGDFTKRSRFPLMINLKVWLVTRKNLASAVENLPAGLDLCNDPPLFF